MADICGLSPAEVDGLWFVDFLTLANGIDARHKQREAGAKGGVWIP